jgi:hypothetical protein
MNTDELVNHSIQKRQQAVILLRLLLTLFCFRVGAQFVQLYAGLSYLPEFSAWHSASIPYPLLLGAQLVIIALASIVIAKVGRDRYRASYSRSRILVWFGWIYFIFMLFRLVLSLTIMQSHAWFGATLPALFHMVLALFLIVLGWHESTQLRLREQDDEC